MQIIILREIYNRYRENHSLLAFKGKFQSFQIYLKNREHFHDNTELSNHDLRALIAIIGPATNSSLISELRNALKQEDIDWRFMSLVNQEILANDDNFSCLKTLKFKENITTPEYLADQVKEILANLLNHEQITPPQIVKFLELPIHPEKWNTWNDIISILNMHVTLEIKICENTLILLKEKLLSTKLFLQLLAEQIEFQLLDKDFVANFIATSFTSVAQSNHRHYNTLEISECMDLLRQEKLLSQDTCRRIFSCSQTTDFYLPKLLKLISEQKILDESTLNTVFHLQEIFQENSNDLHIKTPYSFSNQWKILQKLAELKYLTKELMLLSINVIAPLQDTLQLQDIKFLLSYIELNYPHTEPDAFIQHTLLRLFKRADHERKSFFILGQFLEIIGQKHINSKTLFQLYSSNRLEAIVCIFQAHQNFDHQQMIERLLILSDTEFSNLLVHIKNIGKHCDATKNSFMNAKSLHALINCVQENSLTQDKANPDRTLSQYIIETYYLQPFDGSKKAKLQDGYIERAVHGAMHAARVGIWMVLLHKLFKKHFPDYTQIFLDQIALKSRLSEPEIIFLLETAGISHDTARKDDFADKPEWEANSAKNYQQILHDHIPNISQALLDIFPLAIEHKDCQKNFMESIAPHTKNPNAYDYFRKLLYLADCLDIMRCVGCFKYSKIRKALQDIPGYQEDKHGAIFIEFTLAVHEAIYKQHDMLFACKIRLSETDIIEPEYVAVNNYANRHKVKLEHHYNVYTAIMLELSKISYFKDYLLSKDHLLDDQALQDNLQPKYNPFIHGTSACILSSLERSKALVPLQKLLSDFQLAPMGGELNKRGAKGLSLGDQSCLGKMTVHNSSDTSCSNYKTNIVYDLSHIIDNYSQANKTQSLDAVVKSLKSEVARSKQQQFTNLVVIITYLARARQLNIPEHTLMAQFDYQTLNNQISLTIQLYYLIICLGKYILVNDSAIKSKDEKKAFLKHLKESLTFERLMFLIQESNLDIKNIYTNPNPDSLKSIMRLFESDTHQIFFAVTDPKNINSVHHRQITTPLVVYDYFAEYFLHENDLSKFCYSLFLEENEDPLNQQDLFLLHQQVINQAETLERLQQLLKIIYNSQHTAFNNRELFFAHQNFPLILVCEETTKIRMFDFSSGEYRTEHSLKLGEDITCIATDTREHCLLIMKYLEENAIYNVKVVLFNDLYAAKITKEPPPSIYTHSDGIAKLGWLAAKKLATSKKIDTSDNQAMQKLDDAHKQYLHDAKDYSRLMFD